MKKYNTKELIQRAINIGFKSRLPKEPKNINQSTMIGYNKRMNNWIRILTHLERERKQ